jgi:hypothetical protein
MVWVNLSASGDHIYDEVIPLFVNSQKAVSVCRKLKFG